MSPPEARAADWYDHPRYYDLIFDADTPRERDFLLTCLARFGGARGAAARRVLEPACGSGRLLAALGEAGLEPFGFDLNDNMLAFARRRTAAGPQVTVWRDRMEAFTTPLPAGAFGLAHCLVSTFKYLLDEDAAAACLARVARALAPGGIFVLGLHLCQYADRRSSRERWFARDGALEVACHIESGPPCRRRRREAMRSLLLVRGGRRQIWRRTETTWDFRTYSARQLEALLARVPALEHLTTLGFAYDLRRPQSLHGSRLDAVLVLRRRRAGRGAPFAAPAPSRA